jgi:hypothetical protein
VAGGQINGRQGHSRLFGRTLICANFPQLIFLSDYASRIPWPRNFRCSYSPLNASSTEAIGRAIKSADFAPSQLRQLFQSPSGVINTTVGK